MEQRTDLIDDVVSDIRTLYPTIDAAGLPIVGRVLRLAQMLQARRDQQLAAFGLTVADFDMLASLRRRTTGGSINVRELQSAMMLSSGGMTKRLDRLETAGHLERLPDPADRRGVLIRLTAAGRKVIDQAIPAVSDAESQLVRTSLKSASERKQAEGALRHLLIATLG